MITCLKYKRKCCRRLLQVSVVILVVTVLTSILNFPKETDSEERRQKFLRDVIIKPNIKSSESYDVILSAYMNSGSRFTSRLLGFRPDTFFFYEPLWKFSIWDYFKPPDLQCSTLLGSCRTISTAEANSFQPDKNRPEQMAIIANLSRYSDVAKPEDILLYTLSSVFSCNLVPLLNVVQERVHDNPIYSGPSWDIYKECISKFRRKSECLKKLESVCKSRKHRVAKVLRSTLGTFRPLLQTNPRLKIVHLVRDPRAIIHSRMYSRHYPVYGYRENNFLEINLCDKMLQDYKDGTELMLEFPDKVRFLYYEDLLTNLHVRLKEVMDFLNMRYNQTQIDELALVHVNLSPPEKGNEFVHDRKENNSYWWRKYMQHQDTDRVNRACLDALHAYGYKLLTNQHELRNLNISSYSIPQTLKFVPLS